jgi:hypothetical protein
MENKYPYLDSLEIFFLPCICGHERKDHVHYSEGEDQYTSYISCCHHDKAIFKGMCICSWYMPMTNLEYLEWCYEKSNKVH